MDKLDFSIQSGSMLCMIIGIVFKVINTDASAQGSAGVVILAAVFLVLFLSGLGLATATAIMLVLDETNEKARLYMSVQRRCLDTRHSEHTEQFEDAKLLLDTLDEGSCYKKGTEKFNDMNELIGLVVKGQRKPVLEPSNEAGEGPEARVLKQRQNQKSKKHIV